MSLKFQRKALMVSTPFSMLHYRSYLLKNIFLKINKWANEKKTLSELRKKLSVVAGRKAVCVVMRYSCVLLVNTH